MKFILPKWVSNQEPSPLEFNTLLSGQMDSIAYSIILNFWCIKICIEKKFKPLVSSFLVFSESKTFNLILMDVFVHEALESNL